MKDSSLSRVMLVEDEPDIQAVARVALEAIGGLTVDVCSSGLEAMKRVPEFNPDLILMDVMMPGMDGPTAFRQMQDREETAAYPVIFMTAKVQPHEVARYRELGALGVIAKPFDPMTLAEETRKIWGAS
jgi:CheY-like chemotaxis protein